MKRGSSVINAFKGLLNSLTRDLGFAPLLGLLLKSLALKFACVTLSLALA